MSLSNRIRNAQKQQLALKQFTEQLAGFNPDKLEEHLIKEAESKPNACSCEVKFDTLPGFKQFLNPENNQYTALYWKQWEQRNGIRVAGSNEALVFTWLAHDGSNQSSWTEPKGVEELLGEQLTNNNKRPRTD